MEPRSRSIEDEHKEGVIGASGYAVPITLEDDIASEDSHGPNAEDGGTDVPELEVEMVDALREDPCPPEPFNDLDHVDDNDDKDLEEPEDMVTLDPKNGY